MYINLRKTLRDIERRLPECREPTQRELRQAYDTVLRLRSQVLAALRDREDFEGAQGPEGERIAAKKSGGALWGRTVILSFQEPLPSQKELTAAVEEHWVDMLHAAFQKVAEQGTLPHFQKALVVIHIATPRGSDNTKVWDTSNRAIQVILNNLKGVFFPDDDMEHMAFAVAGHWAEGDGYTIVQVSDFSECQQVFRIPYERLRSSLGISAADLQTDALGTEIE